jgi:hypothetical protein
MGTSLKKHHSLRSVSCYACHIKDEHEKTKDALTPFGKDIAKLVEGSNVTERLEAADELEKEEEDKVKDALKEEFQEVIQKLDKMIAPSGKTYADAMPAGEIEGTKVRN